MDQVGAKGEATGAPDDVATYIHLAKIVSSTEDKAAGMRLVERAWPLARELKLGPELPQILRSRGQLIRKGKVQIPMEMAISRWKYIFSAPLELGL